MKRTKDFADLIRAKLAADPELARAVEVESFNSDIAMKVYDLREGAGLTQAQLAKLVGTTQSVISRIEDADYGGHSLKLLRRIADALGKNLRVEFFARPLLPAVEVVETFSPDWPSVDNWRPDIREGSPAGT